MEQNVSRIVNNISLRIERLLNDDQLRDAFSEPDEICWELTQLKKWIIENVNNTNKAKLE